MELEEVRQVEKRAAFLSVLEFVARNGRWWTRAAGDPAETDAIIRGAADGSVTPDELGRWISERIAEG